MLETDIQSCRMPSSHDNVIVYTIIQLWYGISVMRFLVLLTSITCINGYMDQCRLETTGIHQLKSTSNRRSLHLHESFRRILLKLIRASFPKESLCRGGFVR